MTGRLPAFPCDRAATDDILTLPKMWAGLTKREFFAAMALQGLLAGPQSAGPSLGASAVRYADDLIDALTVKDR